MRPHNSYSPLWFELFMPQQSEESTATEVAFLARHLPLPRYRRVLDLCCGHGRHALALAAQGYAVVGLDRDARALAEARRRAAVAEQRITFVEADMRTVGALAGPFDAVLNMWQSFSYFDEATNRHVLLQVHRLLADDGRCIIDLYNRDYYASHAGRSRREIGGITIDSDGYMVGDRWHAVLRYSDAQGPRGSDHMEWQLYTPAAFTAFVAPGFRVELACAWFDERIPPSAEHARMQFVLQKTEPAPPAAADVP